MFGKTKKNDCADAAVIAGLQSGQGAAFKYAVECLDQTCKPSVGAWLRQRGASVEDAEDLFQDATVELLLALARGATISTTPCGFLFGITRHLWLKKLRNRGRDDLLRNALQAEANEEQFDPKIRGLVEQDNVVQNCWAQISERCRGILSDYYLDDRSFEQIAEKHGYASAHAARQTKLRCLKSLRDCVGPQADPENLIFILE
ncbi:MAG: RNA polymerase sigma factor [Saprospiraceae bacterium]